MARTLCSRQFSEYTGYLLCFIILSNREHPNQAKVTGKIEMNTKKDIIFQMLNISCISFIIIGRRDTDTDERQTLSASPTRKKKRSRMLGEKKK